MKTMINLGINFSIQEKFRRSSNIIQKNTNAFSSYQVPSAITVKIE